MGWFRNTAEDIKLVHQASKIGRAMADNSMTLPDSDASWERLASRYGVPVDYDGALESFSCIVDDRYCEQMIDRGQAEADGYSIDDPWWKFW